VSLRVAASVSARDLNLLELADSVAGLLKVWNVRPSRLSLAIRDAHLLALRPAATEVLRGLRAVGLRLSLDDPGLGLAALARLDARGFEELRLPASLARESATSTRTESVVRALCTFAHDLGMEVLADGVDDAGAAERLKSLGCDVIQGDHVGPMQDATTFIGANQA
jgi:EAL domain-containing protein (putative c-di-GMP-specific phosphodiesterase class I)